MSEMSKKLLRKYVMEQNFTNANEVLDALKGLFRVVLQEALEAELDETLGYSKNDVSSKSTNMNNSRNGYSKKTIKSELGPISLSIPRDRNGEF